MAQPVIRFKVQFVFYIEPGRFGWLRPLINEIMILKLLFAFTQGFVVSCGLII